jgi:hypothetical protein
MTQRGLQVIRIQQDSSVLDPDHKSTGTYRADSGFQLYAYSDLDLVLQIRITLMWIRILLVTLIPMDQDPTFHFDADPDPTFHFYVDADPDPSFQIKANLKKGSNP